MLSGAALVQKRKEAEAHKANAEKQLKTTISRWKPNYDAAGDAYVEAGLCYRLTGEIANSMECYRLASTNYKFNQSYYHAAKALETSINVGKDEPLGPEVFQKLAIESADLYRLHGSGDSAAAVLVKVAKLIKNDSPVMALELYQRAVDASYAASSNHSAAEHTSSVSRILVQLKRYDDAIASVCQEIGYHVESGNTGAIGRLTVVGVLINLAREDVVAADKLYKLWGSYCEQAEVDTLEALLKGFEDRDDKVVLWALRAPFIRSMDVEYACLATQIKCLGSGKVAGSHGHAGASGGQAAAAYDEENQFEAADQSEPDQSGGLC